MRGSERQGKMAERVGFEPTEGLHLHLISSQARSTGLRHLSESAKLAASGMVAQPPELPKGPGRMPAPRPRATVRAEWPQSPSWRAHWPEMT